MVYGNAQRSPTGSYAYTVSKATLQLREVDLFLHYCQFECPGFSHSSWNQMIRDLGLPHSELPGSCSSVAALNLEDHEREVVSPQDGGRAG